MAIIPARGGSKRIPKKNIKPFAGKPIIAYSIEVAQKSGLFDRVIVSTDSDEIADVSLQSGAEVPFRRPAELADDHSGTNAVMKHAIQWAGRQGQRPSYVCCIYPTAPLLRTTDIVSGFEKLSSSDKQFSFSVTEFPFPILRSVRLKESDTIEAIWPEHVPKRSQDLEPAFHDAGQFYWGRPEAFLNEVMLFSTQSIAVVLPTFRVMDIDTPDDWQRAELMYLALKGTGNID
ncbi:MAG: pseudaminic acid cytidylyltransferase [Filomicrobium sp.]